MLALNASQIQLHLWVVAFGDVDLRLEVGLLIELLCALEILVGIGVGDLLNDLGLGDLVEVVRLGLFHLVLEFVFLHPLKFIILYKNLGTDGNQSQSSACFSGFGRKNDSF